MDDERDSSGRFVAGVWKGGPGRPAKTHEERYGRIFSATIPLEKFQASCLQIWLDSVGKKIDKNGKLIDDPHSSPFTRVNAFTRIALYVMGRPVDPGQPPSKSDEILELYSQLSGEEIEGIVHEAYEMVQGIKAGRRREDTMPDDDKLLPAGE